MAMPKLNSDMTSLAFGGASLVGVLLTVFAYTGGRLGGLFPGHYFENFVIFSFGLYGVAFVAAPKFLLEENFHKSVDKYHEAIARSMGSIFLLNSYTLYSGMLGGNSFAFACLWGILTGLFGPTWNAFFLECKMTPTGHAPGNILFLVNGILAVTSK